MPTKEPKPTAEDKDVQEWERLLEHTPPPDASRWRPDDERESE